MVVDAWDGVLNPGIDFMHLLCNSFCFARMSLCPKSQLPRSQLRLLSQLQFHLLQLRRALLSTWKELHHLPPWIRQSQWIISLQLVSEGITVPSAPHASWGKLYHYNLGVSLWMCVIDFPLTGASICVCWRADPNQPRSFISQRQHV